MAPAALVVTAIASTMAAYGSYRQGQYAKRAGEYNAQIAERDAEMAAQKAEYDAEASTRKFKMLMGKQRALYSKSGVDISKGSPLLMLTLQAEEAERERQAIYYGGDVASQQERSRAEMSRFQGEEAAIAGRIGAGSTFLTGLGNVGTDYYNYKNPRRTYY